MLYVGMRQSTGSVDKNHISQTRASTPLTHVPKRLGDPQVSFYVYHDMGENQFLGL